MRDFTQRNVPPQTPSRPNFGDFCVRQAGPASGIHRLIGLNDIDQVMRDASLLFCRWFGGSNIKVTIDLNTICTDNFTAPSLCQLERELALTRSRGPHHN